MRWRRTNKGPRGRQGASGRSWVDLLPLLVVGAALGFGVSLAHPGRSDAQAGSAQPVSSPSVADGGQAIFLRDCAVCHGSDASGTSYGPSLQGVGVGAVDYWVTTGRMPLRAAVRPAKSPENEPPLDARLPDPNAQPHPSPVQYSPAEIQALEAYFATVAPGGPGIPTVNLADADLATGGELYRLQCAACHEWAGVGGALYQREAPSLHGATPTQVAEAIITGPGQMPKFGPPAIPSGQVNDVVGYVRYLDHPEDPGGNPLWYLGPVAEGAIAIVLGLGALLLVTRWIGDRS